MAADLVKKPWTQSQVDALNAFQIRRQLHPFTCGSGNRTDAAHLDGEGLLVATPNGWICPYCDYRQDWAHPFMLTPASTMAADERKEVLPGLTLEQLAEALWGFWNAMRRSVGATRETQATTWAEAPDWAKQITRGYAKRLLPTLEACVLRERLAEHDEMPCTIKNYGRSDKWAHLCGCQCGCGFRCPHRITLESQLAAKEAEK